MNQQPKKHVQPLFNIITKGNPNSIYYSFQKIESKILIVSSTFNVFFDLNTPAKTIAKYLIHRIKDIDDQIELMSNINMWFGEVTCENLELAIDCIKNIVMVTDHYHM